MTVLSKKTCWVVSDGRKGVENQALGLAEAIGREIPLAIEVKRIAVKAPYRFLPARLLGDPFKRLTSLSDLANTQPTISSPFPDLWIASGRITLPFSMAVKKAQHSFVVQTQDPRISSEKFDIVVPPCHDDVTGENVIAIHGAPNRLTETRLHIDADKLRDALPNLARPLFAVLIGGDSKAYKLTEQNLDNVISHLKVIADSRAGLMITTSRRTGDENTNRLREAVTGEKVFFWGGEPIGDLANPYFGMLGLADHILVTEESTNMITDAAFTGKPVHLLPLAGGHPKFERFHKALEDMSILRDFAMPLREWTYEPLRETDRAAKEIIRHWLGNQP